MEIMKTNDLQFEINELHAEICSALADPRRILILYVLAEKTTNVTELANEVGISQPTASRHLTASATCPRMPPSYKEVSGMSYAVYMIVSDGLTIAPRRSASIT